MGTVDSMHFIPPRMCHSHSTAAADDLRAAEHHLASRDETRLLDDVLRLTRRDIRRKRGVGELGGGRRREGIGGRGRGS